LAGLIIPDNSDQVKRRNDLPKTDRVSQIVNPTCSCRSLWPCAIISRV